MKSKFDWIMPLLVVVVLALAYSTYHLHRERNAYKKKAQQLEYTAAHIGYAPVTHTTVKTDKGDVTVASTEPVKATDKIIKARHSGDMKVVQGASGVRPKDVDELSHIEVSTSDSVTAPVKVEPFGGLSTHFEDDYATIDVRIDSAKTATIGYEVRDSLVIVSWSKQHSILFGLIKWKGKKQRIEAFSKNPRAVVKSVEVLQRLE